MTNFEKIKKDFQHELRLWTAELQRGRGLKAKANTKKKYKNADTVIKDAQEGIDKTEENLRKLENIKAQLESLTIHKKPYREMMSQ